MNLNNKIETGNRADSRRQTVGYGRYIARKVKTLAVSNTVRTYRMKPEPMTPARHAAIEAWLREGEEARRRVDAYYRVISNSARTVESVSFADTLKKTPCVSVGCSSGLPPPKKEKVVHDISTAEARRQYTAAFKTFQKERSEARALAEAIAERYAIVRFVHKKRAARKPSLAKIIRSARRTMREAMKPRAMPAFHFDGCEYEGPADTDKVGPWFFKKNFKTTGSRGFGKVKKSKVVKQQQQPKEDDMSWYEPQVYVPLPVEETPQPPRRLRVYLALSRTPLGQALVMGFARVKAQRLGLSIEEAQPETLEPQMDTEPATGTMANLISKMSNTAIDALQPVDRGINHSRSQGYRNLAVSGERQNYESMVNRWIYLKDYTWTKNDAVGSVLDVPLWLPDYILRNNKDSINTQVFFTHRWFRGDMRIRITLNSNRFQVGKLIASVLYGREDDDLALWDNLYSSLQRNHVSLVAGISNDAELVIPFKWMDAVMSPAVDCKMCKFVIRVLNPLVITDGSANQAKLTISASFENIEFYAMINRSLGLLPQMDSAANLLNAGSDLIRTIRGDANRDNPPLPLQPVSFIPQSMTSLALMDHIVEPINVLRADPAGQTPHTELSDEMNTNVIAQSWGYRSTVEWRTTHVNGDNLWYTDVLPLHLQDQYPQVNGKDQRVPTPVSYVSSLFGFWRGDMEYRFDVVASAFHTGRLMIGSVPLYQETSVSLDILKCSANLIGDIASTSSLIFRAPWQWKNAFAENRIGNSLIDVPSRLFLVVVNSLTAVASVPPVVYINIFERGASNFEMAIPRPPIWDPLYKDPVVIPSTTYLKPYDTNASWYTTWERNLLRKDGKYAVTIYYKNVTDGWVGYTNLGKGLLYKLSKTTSKSKSLYQCEIRGRARTKKPDSNDYDWHDFSDYIAYGVYDEALSSSNAHGLIVFPENRKEEAIRYCKDIRSGLGATTARSRINFGWREDGDWSQIWNASKNQWEFITDQDDRPVWEQVNLENEIDFEVVEGQMDPQDPTTSIPLDIPTPSSSGGLSTFGERTPDLKSLCRRYNLYCSMVVKTSSTRVPRDAPYSARIKVNPLRRVNPVDSSTYDNRFRHGVITTIGSMYKFWKGGLRMRFVVVGTPPEGTVLYVQHRYDKNLSHLEDNFELGPLQVRNRDDLMSTQYATFAQVLGVNSSFVVEIPYYQQQELLSIPISKTSPRDNGSVYIWLHSKSVQSVNIEVLLSFADDTRFSVYQGIPKCLDMSEIKNEPTPQMDPEPNGFFDKIINSAVKVNGIDNSVEEAKEKIKEVSGSIASTSHDVSNLCKTADVLIKKVTKAFDLPEQPTESNIMETIKAKVSAFALNSIQTGFDKLFKYISPFVYVILSPTIGTVCWAMVNIFYAYFGFQPGVFERVTTFVTDLWEKFRPSQPTQGGVSPQMDDDDDVFTGYCGFLYSMLATVCGIKAQNLKLDFNGIAKGLFTFSMAARSSKFVIEFLKSNIELLKRVFNKIVAFFSVKDQSAVQLVLGQGDNRLQNWFAESQVVLAPQNSELVITDPIWIQKVFELSVVGRALSISIVNSSISSTGLLPLIQSTTNELKKLEKKLIDSKVYSGVRYEPFTLWISGEAGTGKTRYLQDVARELAKSSGYAGHVPYHTMTAGQKYFDAYVGQPTILIDDFLAMSASTDPESYVQYLQMASSSLFNPPYSMTEDKNKLINFQNLLVSSNCSYFNNNVGIHDADAYNRRRDCLLEFRRKEKGMSMVEMHAKYNAKDLHDMKHLDVFVHDNPMTQNGSVWQVTAKDLNGKTLREWVDDRVFKTAARVHTRNTENYARDCIAARDAMESVKGVADFNQQLMIMKKSLKMFDQKDTTVNWSSMFSPWLAKSEEASTFVPPLIKQNRHEEREPPTEPTQGSSATPEVILSKTQKKKLAKQEREKVQNQMNPHPPQLNGHMCFPYRPEDWVEGPDMHQLYMDNPHTAAWFPKGQCYHTIFKPQRDWFYIRDKKWFVDSLLSSKHYVFGTLCRSVTPEGCSGNRCVLFNDPDAFFTLLDAHRPVEFSIGHIDSKIYSAHVLQQWYSPEYSAFVEKKMLYGEPDIKMDTFATEMYQYRSQRLKEQIEAIRKHESSFFRKIGNFFLNSKKKMIIHGQVGTPVDRWFFERIASVSVLINIIWCTVACFASVLIIKGLIGLYKYNNSTENQLHPSGDYQNIKNARTVRTNAARLLTNQGEDWVQKALTDPKSQPKNGAINKIRNNMFTMVGKVPVKGTDSFTNCVCHCVGLYNHTFLVLEHYIDHFNAVGVTEVAIVFRGGTMIFHCLLKDIKFTWGPQGYGTGELPSTGCPRQFSKILHLIPSEKFDGNYPSKVILLKSDVFDSEQQNLEMKRLASPINVPGTSTQKGWVIEQGFEYPYGGKGLCGSVLIAPEMACPFIGVHTAGINTKRGYSELLLRETFEEPGKIPVDFYVPQMETDDQVYELSGLYEEVGKLPANLVPRTVSKTKIVPSEIHGVFPVVSEPAPLQGNDERLEVPADILRIGVSKRCDPMKPYPREDEDKVMEHFLKKILRVVKPQRAQVGVLSYAEAIDGLPLPGYDSLTLSTSEGYPWNLERPTGASGKAWMVHVNEDIQEVQNGRRQTIAIHPDLYTVLEFNEDLRRAGIVPISHYQSQLKDARISKKKIPIPGSTRVFEMSPFHLTIAQRQYNLDFTVAYRAARLAAEHTIGINPDGPEWTELAEELINFSDKISTADFKGYGPRISHQLVYMSSNVNEIWCYEHEKHLPEPERLSNLIVREVLKYEVANGLHVCRNLVFRPSSGQPSGNPETVEANSKTNSCNIRFAFLGLAREHAPHYADLAFFDMFVKLFTNGDDLIMSIKDEIIGWFNNQTLIEFFGRYGLIMTDAEKSGVVRPYCSLEEASYLKRGFKRHPTRQGQWMAPLNEDSVTDTANWCWRSVNHRGDSLQNSEMSCRLAYTLGPDRYYEIANAIRDAWLEKNVIFDFPSWESLDNHVWDGVTGPLFYYYS